MFLEHFRERRNKADDSLRGCRWFRGSRRPRRSRRLTDGRIRETKRRCARFVVLGKAGAPQVGEVRLCRSLRLKLLLFMTLSVTVRRRLVKGTPLWRRITAPVFLPGVLALGPVRGPLLLFLLLTLGAVLLGMPVFIASMALDTGGPSRHRHTTTRDGRCRRLPRKLVDVHIRYGRPYLSQAEVAIPVAGCLTNS